MTCECKTELEAKLLERFKANVPEATDHGAQLSGYGLAVIGNSMVMRPTMPVTVSAVYPLKRGGTRLRKSTQTMFFSYCPFCGVKL